MKTVYLATGNKHKLEEIGEVFSKFGIEVKGIDLKPEEDKTKTIQEIAKNSAKVVAEKIKKPAMADDTGIFFTAMDNWPGNSPGDIFREMGYEGIFKALKGKTREAYFETAAAYCEPGKEPVVFSDRLKGKITKEVVGVNREVMPYEKIFIPEGYDEVIGLMPEIKKKISHRIRAFKKVAEYIVSKT